MTTIRASGAGLGGGTDSAPSKEWFASTLPGDDYDLVDALAYAAEIEADPTPPTSSTHRWLVVLAKALRAMRKEREELRLIRDALLKLETDLVAHAGVVMPESLSMWYAPMSGAFYVESAAGRRAVRDRLIPAILWWAAEVPKPERAPEHRALTERCAAAERERDEALALADSHLRDLQGANERLTTLGDALAKARGETEEARLTLAAEQGRKEGSPSEGWEFQERFRQWCKPLDAAPDGDHALVQPVGTTGGDAFEEAGTWHWTIRLRPEGRTGIATQGYAPTARAAMQAADKAAP